MGIISLHIYAKYANSTDTGPLYERQQYKMVVGTVYRKGVHVYLIVLLHVFFSSCPLALCLIDLTSPMVKKAKDFFVKAACTLSHIQWSSFKLSTHSQEPYRSWRSKTHSPVKYKMNHSSPFTDAAGKSVSSLSQKTIWKPVPFFIRGGEFCDASNELYGPRWKEDIASEDIHHPDWIIFKPEPFICQFLYCNLFRVQFNYSIGQYLHSKDDGQKTIVAFILQNIYKLLWTVKKKKQELVIIAQFFLNR